MNSFLKILYYTTPSTRQMKMASAKSSSSSSSSYSSEEECDEIYEDQYEAQIGKSVKCKQFINNVAATRGQSAKQAQAQAKQAQAKQAQARQKKKNTSYPSGPRKPVKLAERINTIFRRQLIKIYSSELVRLSGQMPKAIL